MLSPSEFSVGCIGDATTILTLVLPRDCYEQQMLITQASGSPYAIFLAGEHQFAGFQCTNNSSWNGVLIPNINIEIDERSIFDANSRHAPLGALVRRDTQLAMITQANNAFRESIKTPIIVNLPPCRENMSAGFKKWCISLGEGTAKRELIRLECASE